CFAACQFRPMLYTSPLISGASYTWEIIGNGTITNISPNEIEVLWSTLGVQAIKLTVSNGAGCSNTFEKCVRVIESPTAIIGTAQFLYLSGQPIRVCKNSDFYLEDISTGAIGRRWNFGDGNSSDEISITHSYSQGGTYQVILTANNACFCLDSDTITVIVDDSEGAEIVCIGAVCEGDTLDYSAITDCREFRWRLLGSHIGITHDVPFDNAIGNVVWKQHPAFLEYTGADCPSGCATSVVEKIAVLIDSIPIKGASPACIGDVNSYSIEPIPGSDYIWTVPTSLGNMIEDHGYWITVEITGSGTIGLNYSNNILGCSGNTEKLVLAKERLNFAMPNELCNSSSSSYSVDFPIDWSVINAAGETVYTDINVSNTAISWAAFSSGDYTLQLGKRNSYCNDLQFSFTILPAPDAPDSIYGANTICALTAYFFSVDPKSGHRVEWLVNGGTPETSTGNTITISWYNSGPYSISAAYRQLESPNCLSAYAVKTVAPSFTGTKAIVAADSACGGDTANIKLNFITDNVQWTVVTPTDGASIITNRFSSEIKVQFSAATTQNVIFQANGRLCGIPFTLQKTVFVQSFPTPTISFSDPNPCPHSPVTFTTSANSPTWLIDGLTYTAISPILSFDSARTIQAQVTAKSIGPMGCKVERVNIEPLIVKVLPKANIVVFDTNSNHCKDTLSPIILSAALQGVNSSAYIHQWIKNGVNILGANGTSYTTPNAFPHGSYRVQVTAPNSCVSTSNSFRIDTCSFVNGDGCPSILADTNVSVSIILNSSNCSDFFVDSVIVNAGQLLDIRFSNSNIPVYDVGTFDLGFYLAAGYHSLTFEGSVVTTTNDTLCFSIEIEKQINVEPDFRAIKQPCSSNGMERYEFKNISTYVGTLPQFTWNFGNNAILVSNGYDPIVAFAAGTHFITLTAVGTSCSISKQIIVNIPTTANFVSTAPACQQELVDFTNLSSGNIIEYKWDLGGQILFDENPSVTFVDQNNLSNDIYPFVDLYVLGSNGCRDTLTKRDTISGNLFNGSVKVLGGITTICEGNSTTLAFDPTTIMNANIPITYNWSNQESTQITNVNQTGFYQLKMTDNVGCRFVSNQLNIQVNTAPNPSIIGKQTFCADDSVQLSILNHPSYTINWIVDSTVTGNLSSKFSMKLPTGTYQISTNAINTLSTCPSTNAPFPVTVLAGLAKPVISSRVSAPLCEGSALALVASPSVGNFYWNTGQSSNSITESLAGRYTVIQTDISGCQSNGFIDINPLPDFSNFMTGCYCLPSQSPTHLLGIPNMASYQWKKDGIKVSAPVGTMQDITASTGSFELIAVSDSGCVDSAGVIDISMGGCDPCLLNLSNLTVNCIRINGDSAFYDFTVEAGVNNVPTLYDLSANVIVRHQPAILQQLQPAKISGNSNLISGSFVLLDSISNAPLCIILTASNTTVNCSAEICTTLSPVACNIQASFKSIFDKENCSLSLINTSTTADNCIAIHEDSIRWELTFQGKTYVKIGNEVTFYNMRNDVASICMTVGASDFSGNITCEKKVCDEFYIPDCRCEEECGEIYVTSAYFHQFIVQDDSCIIRFYVEIVDANGTAFDVNSMFGKNGTVLGSQLLSANGGTQAYYIDFYPNEDWKEGVTCFDFFITTEDGATCCIVFCIELPSCNFFSRKRSPSLVQSGLSSKDKNSLFNAYPNPAKNTLFVEWETALDETIEVILLDHNSKVVYQDFRLVQGNKIELSLNNYLSGVYVLEIKRKEIASQEKIVILK
ncbi:MAG: PKD domain-containing protein, partial [Flavobacteriales bacterium]|nr:PKD domain-containing protein [Flavobacteriales bacterium]